MTALAMSDSTCSNARCKASLQLKLECNRGCVMTDEKIA